MNGDWRAPPYNRVIPVRIEQYVYNKIQNISFLFFPNNIKKFFYLEKSSICILSWIWNGNNLANKKRHLVWRRESKAVKLLMMTIAYCSTVLVLFYFIEMPSALG
jgi:hypothetical protein